MNNAYRRGRRLYRVTGLILPPDAEDALNDGEYWEPANWREKCRMAPGHPEQPPPFRWPWHERLYLSRSGARDRVKLLREYGARAEVEVSEPLVWPSEQQAAIRGGAR